MRKVIHNHNTWRSNGEPCGEVGIYYSPDKKPKCGEPLLSEDFKKLSGENFKRLDAIICGNCGQYMMITIEDIQD